MPARTVLLVKGLFDGTRGEPLADAAVAVEDDRIVGCGRAADVPRAGAEIVDATRYHALPGFINMHVHLDSECLADFVSPLLLASEQSLALLAVSNARDALRAGVTTLRDLGNRACAAIAVRDAIAKGWIDGPRIHAAGKAVCMTGGHGWFIGEEADGPDDLRRAVRANLKRGADCIKVIATGGVLTPGVEVGNAQLDEDEMSAAVREAHKAGRRVAAHAIGMSGVKNALRAGVDTIEHGCYLDDESVALFRERDATFVPTLSAPHFLREHISELPAYAARKTDEVYEAHRESFRLALRGGVRIATGTDAGTPFNLQRLFAKEFELMTDLGMAVEDALLAGSRNAAMALGRDDVGRIAPGARADVVLVADDPRRDVTTLQRVAGVMLGGRLERTA